MGHWSWVTWVIGQFTDGSDGSWDTKCAPLSALVGHVTYLYYTSTCPREADLMTMRDSFDARLHNVQRALEN